MSGFDLATAARQDLSDITDYIAADSPAAADRFLDAMWEAFQLLAEQPGIGHRRSDLTARPVRFWSVRGRYMIVYRERGAKIEVLRIVGAGRDISALLGD